ncbi:hypothetical protein CKM354_001075300 [Cercospora kikuchii]|uniref:Uncharacterized protein n=1 Tax=Cercospora kikuchii TaxID=84275 RepID=A0A9P3CZI6_9PEZI|nr:uncharacterized protein CKM354_001075300 [Cercospora kikuchii]GIZ47668.1 hypothetical protein CKM354_001075300 [Cercospora kikuchii]
MSRSNPTTPSQNPRDNNAPKPPSLSIQEALAKANRERLAEFANTEFPRTTPQPSPFSNPPYRFVNPQDVEKTDVSKFWRAGEIKAEQNGEFLEECRRERQKRKEAKGSDDGQNKNDGPSAEKDPEPASPKPPKKGPNEWKWLKGIEAGLPARRSSTHWNNTDNNGQ